MTYDVTKPGVISSKSEGMSNATPRQDALYLVDMVYNEVQQAIEDVNRLGTRLLPISGPEEAEDFRGPSVYSPDNSYSPLSGRVREILVELDLLRGKIDSINRTLDLP